MNKSDKTISIVIPCYNEEDHITFTVDNVINYMLDKFNQFEIIIVNDCSTDKSKEIIDRYVRAYMFVSSINNVNNSGKGFSVREGMSKARYDHILIMDADSSTNIREIEKLIKHTPKYDMILGSRHAKSSIIMTNQTKLRRIYGRVFNNIVNRLLSFNIKDTQNGFKLYSRKAVDKITHLSVIDGFAFDVEHVAICKDNLLKIKEVGITWEDRKPNKIKISQILNMYDDIIRIKKNKDNGLYVFIS